MKNIDTDRLPNSTHIAIQKNHKLIEQCPWSTSQRHSPPHFYLFPPTLSSTISPGWLPTPGPALADGTAILTGIRSLCGSTFCSSIANNVFYECCCSVTIFRRTHVVTKNRHTAVTRHGGWAFGTVQLYCMRCSLQGKQLTIMK